MLLIDISGNTYGRLTVLKYSGASKWTCQCACGIEKAIHRRYLMDGQTVSCGCQKLEALMARLVTHGASKTREYTSWKSMRKRCLNPNEPKYPSYGGRGVTISTRWDNFEAFLEDMGPRPLGCTLDRIDCNGNYSAENCRWASPVEQANNKRSNRLVAANGKTQNVTQWAKDIGINRGTIKQRLRRGWSDDDAINTPVGAKHNVKFSGDDVGTDRKALESAGEGR